VGFLIDASVLIGHGRGRLDLDAQIDRLHDQEFFLSVVTASELLHGVHRSKDPTVRSKRSAFVEAILERFPILPVSLATARTHARIWAELAAAGVLIGANDLWLASTAVAHGLSLVTLNVREFARVPGVQIENWGRVIGGAQGQA
jgi:predicted nucleic acid-binding protein